MIRAAAVADVPAMLELYRPYIEHTAVSFETVVPTVEAFQARFLQITADYPWLVLEEDGALLGYAYASRAFERAAYAWCADLAIYLRRDAVGQGRGTALYFALEQELRHLGVHILYSLVTTSNAPSLRFHAAVGFRTVGELPDSGWKFGAWHSVTWMEKRLFPPENAPSGPPLRWENGKNAENAAGFR